MSRWSGPGGLLAVAALTAGALVLARVAWPEGGPVGAAAPAGPRTAQQGAGPGLPAGPAPAAAPQAAGPAAQAQAFAQWVAASSALRGTALDGDWGMDAAGQLQPTPALRRRFDHLLQLQGQAPLEAISAHLRWLAGQDLSPAQCEAVMQVWQRYLGLQQAPVSTVVRPDQPDTLGPALAERQQLRRQWLGPAWAQAFYGEEEAALQAWMNRSGGAAAEAPPLIDRSSLDAQALQRLVQEEASQARWQRRLAQARAEMARLAAAPELSELQRTQALERLLDERFSGTDRVRARALLALPGAAGALAPP